MAMVALQKLRDSATWSLAKWMVSPSLRGIKSIWRGCSFLARGKMKVSFQTKFLSMVEILLLR